MLAVLVALLPVVDARAQTSTGSITGIVTGEGGAPVPGTQIIAREVGTNFERRTLSRDNGYYFLGALRPGQYQLSTARIGFERAGQPVQVQIGQNLKVDFQLTATAITLSTVVTTAGASVETRTAEQATNVSQEQIQAIPTVDRNFLDLASLAPGVRIQGGRQEGTTKTFTSGALPATNINVFIDGATYKNDVLPGGVAGQETSRGNPFPQNAVQEFRVITDNYKAEYQKASSAIITATTRSGTNEFHGSLFSYVQGKNFAANDTFFNARNPKPPKPDYKRYLTGVSLGGPIIRDKLHFFGTYEGNYQDRTNQVRFGSVPTLPPGFAGKEGVFTSPFRSNLFFGKLSLQQSDRSSFELSANVRHETDIRSFGGDRSFDAAENVKNDVGTYLLKHRYGGDRFVNEATVSYQQYKWNPVAENEGLIGLNYFGVGRIGGRETSQKFDQGRLSIRNDVTVPVQGFGGDHTFKFGGNFDRASYDVEKRQDGNPVFNFRSDENYAFPFEAFYGFGNPNLDAKNNQVGVYAQDDWALTRRLTVNIGVRWDYESDMLNNDYVTPPDVAAAARAFGVTENFISDGSNREPFMGAIQPRVGFSYAIDEAGRTAVFGGFGIFYDRSTYNDALDERFRLQWQRLQFRFSTDGLPRDGQPTIVWDPSYLSRAGLDALVASAQAPDPEVFLIDNDTRPPKSHQFTAGIRHTTARYVFSLSYAGVRSFNGFTYVFGNRQINPADPNAFPATGDCCRPFAPGQFGNLLLSSSGVRTWNDAFYFKADRPYRRAETKWGAGIAYTYQRASQVGGDLFSLDFPGVAAYPHIPTNNDERHRVIGNWITDIPFGIQFSGLLTLGSGTPYWIDDASQGFGPGLQVIRRNAGRPEKFDFIIPNAWAYRLVDVRLRKDFAIGTSRLGIIGDVYNIFNFQNFGNYDGFIRPLNDPNGPNPNFGKPREVIADSRRAQIGLAYDF